MRPVIRSLVNAAAGLVPCLALSILATAAWGQPPAPDGRALFHEKCAMCHGPNGMGTLLLGRRVQPAELTQRNNLTADQVFTLARLGVGNMPAISRGEVSDAQLKAIASYVATGPEAAR
jgi:mono/diheme cytochrome c family protein